MSDEPLLCEDNNRLVMFPVKYQDVYEMYKVAQGSFWRASEIAYATDAADWERSSEGVRRFVSHVLAFFAASDGIVCENLCERFSKDVPHAEVKAFYAFQNAMETVHSEVYSQLIDVFVKDQVEKRRLLNASREIPSVAAKAAWALKWISSDAPFARRLVAFAVVEGVFFSSAFAAIYYLKTKNLFSGLCQSNEWISRDEALHTEFAVLLYTKISRRIPQEHVHEMFREAMELEVEFITDAIPCTLIGMNADSMLTYVKFVADRLLYQLGYDKLYGVTNPFDFMEQISMSQKTSFFERRVTDYARAADSECAFDADADF